MRPKRAGAKVQVIDEPAWYVQKRGRLLGPYHKNQIDDLIQKREMSFSDLAWTESAGSRWLEIGNFPEFGGAQNNSGEDDGLRLDIAGAKTLCTNSAVTASEEKTEAMKTSAISLLFPAGAKAGPAPKIKPKKKNDRADIQKNPRVGKRAPLMATISTLNPAPKVIGVCRNVSGEGMLVLGGTSPGPVGSEHLFRVQPADGLGIPTFEVKGAIIRIVSQPAGFAVKFLSMTPQAQKSLKDYIS